MTPVQFVTLVVGLFTLGAAILLGLVIWLHWDALTKSE